MDIGKLVEQIYNLGKPAESEKERIEDLKNIKEILEPVLKITEEAKKKKMYLKKKLGDDDNLWLSPENLEKELKKGNMLYCVDMWELVSPILRIEEMQNEIIIRQIALKEFTREVAKFMNEKR